MKNVLITGGSGQLASCIKDVAIAIENCNFLYANVDELDITNPELVKIYFKNKKITHCINCAAYTAVDKAETDKVLADRVNNIGAKHLAKACAENGALMIQISTDFVFDGSQGTLYKEIDQTNPLGVYGATKLQGELSVAKALKEHFILRTSWLYSEHGNNFLKTMLRLGKEREELNVVTDQIGTPTYAGDLAKIILGIVTNDSKDYGVYHYSNEGVASWYDFAKAIFDLRQLNCKVMPINTAGYPTPAKRPPFSVMDKSKIKTGLGIKIPYWRESLEKCLSVIKP